jgi:hypothetical protein
LKHSVCFVYWTCRTVLHGSMRKQAGQKNMWKKTRETCARQSSMGGVFSVLPIKHLCLSKLTYLQSRLSVAHLSWNVLFQSTGRWLEAQHCARHISKPFCLSSGVWQTLATSFLSFHGSQITLAPVCLMLWTQSSCLVRHNNNWFCLSLSLLYPSCPSNLHIVL